MLLLTIVLNTITKPSDRQVLMDRDGNWVKLNQDALVGEEGSGL